jgi:hypothetical protein
LQSLTDIHEPTSSLVLSLLPTEIRLLGYNENFPWNDPYSEIFTVKDELMLRNWIDYSGPRRILVEKISDDSIANRKPRTRFYERIMSSQDRYSEKKENKFFRVYERNDHINLVSDF